MSWDQRATLIILSASVIVPWVLTEITHSLQHALGWGCKR